LFFDKRVNNGKNSRSSLDLIDEHNSLWIFCYYLSNPLRISGIFSLLFGD
jgi:hypothetical protein